MWDETTFQTYLRNNECPTEDLAAAIQERLTDPSAELATLDTEIDELRKRLKDVQSRRNALRASLYHYYVVMSPIRRLPDDVLQEIFVHTLRDDVQPEFYPWLEGYKNSPIVLTRVCRRWRYLAFETHRLWNKLSISPPSTASLLASPTDQATVTQTEQLDPRLVKHQLARSKRLAAAIRDWLDRSGVLPLSIHICHPTYFSPYARLDGAQFQSSVKEILSNVFKAVAEYSSRWRELQLMINDPRSFILFSSHISLDGLPNLEVFKCENIHPHRSEQWTEILSSPLYTKAPALRRLYSALPPSIEAWPYDAHTWRWITHLDLANTIHIADGIAILQKCPNLIHLQLRVGPVTQARPAPESQTIRMENLRQLEICFANDNTFNDHFSTVIASTSIFTIVAPELNHLTYITDKLFYGIMARTIPPPDISINFPLQHIVTGVNAFDYLHTTPVTQEACDQLKATLLMPECRQLRTLCIGRAGVRSQPELNKFSVSGVDRAFKTLFKLPDWFQPKVALQHEGPLLTIEGVTRDMIDEALQCLVCPNLQHIELLGLHSICEIAILVWMIYRLRLYEYSKHKLTHQGSTGDEGVDEDTRRKYHIAPLTVIRMSFSRNKKYDVLKDIRILAKTLGVKLEEVKAEYPEKPQLSSTALNNVRARRIIENF